MEISTNIQLIAKPGMGVELLELLKNILPDTRSYDDNLGQYLVSDVEDSEKLRALDAGKAKKNLKLTFNGELKLAS